jgi:preprotein translocase subunit SecG
MSSILFSYLLPVVHVLACIFLIVVVLLQTGKGADMGAVLGGGSQTLFGASGAGNLLTKLTTGMAITFMATSLLLVLAQRQRPSSSLLNRLPETPPAAAPLDVPPPPAAPNAAADIPAAPAEPAQQADAKPADAPPAAPATPPVADAKPADAPGAVPPPPGAPTDTPPPAVP